MSIANLTPEAYQEAISKAQEDGFVVVQGSPTFLLLDLDDPASEQQYNRVLPLLQQNLAAIEYERWASKSGKLHILVQLSLPLPITTRIALQAVLGSDSVREMLSILAVSQGVEEPSLLFKPSQKHSLL